ncbi:carboxypeptidase-like regulatory domain-containing protein [Melittangium boletus]|uniref:Carboxypeptidase regulatory-like domain-containing protein n=1 Tax=Melittangium boletus DSM 14713 TaxID=1294270 RepID=A0A250IKC0_9BACT|nr:carboxypeptidase-like regulatory domain-containing protein [Melittangium boletus]ATB31366.1 hypothetical protein MEBOL_004828 [Melittangium boletus DSM 14713]
MRGRLIAVAILGALALALLGVWRLVEPGTGEDALRVQRGEPVPGASEPPLPGSRERTGPTPASAPERALSEADGILEVRLLAGERPVPGAQARLYWRGARDPNLGEFSWRRMGEGRTDGQGRVQLAAGPGNYLVSVRADGHAPLLRHVVRPLGEARTRIELRLEPGLTLEGRTVVHGTKEPLPLVQLVLTPRAPELAAWLTPDAPDEECVHASSDTRGNFRVDGLAPGTYQLEARTPGYARTVLHRVKVPSTEPLEVALRLAGVIEGFVVDARGAPATGAEVLVSGKTAQQLTTGEGGGFSGEVEAGTYTVTARRGEEAAALREPLVVSAGRTVRGVRLQLGPGAVLEGRVWARATGAPVADAHVDISPLGGNGDLGRASTDGEGRFSVSGLAPGAYDVVVGAPGFSSVLRRGVTVDATERFPLDVVLASTGRVEGWVRDTEGRPVVSARVLTAPSTDVLETSPVEARTDAEGHYQLEGLKPGYQRLIARREGATQGIIRPAEVSESGTARVDFTLEETGIVEGVVRGRLPEAPLEATAHRTEGGGPGWGERSGAPVDPGGTFRMELPPGTYVMGLWAFRPAARIERVQVRAGETTRVELTWDEEPHTGSVGGVVLEPDGQPSPGAIALLYAEGQESSLLGVSLADEEGHFHIDLPVGSQDTERLRVHAFNGGRRGRVSGVRPGTEGVGVKLEPGATLRGRVVRQGRPVQGFTLTFDADRHEPLAQPPGPWEFPGERFEMRDVPAGPATLVVRTVDGARGVAQVAPRAGTTTEVDISVDNEVP